MTLADQLRRAVRAAPQNRVQICKAIRLDQGQMSNFLKRKAGLSMEVSERLARALGMEIKLVKKGSGTDGKLIKRRRA